MIEILKAFIRHPREFFWTIRQYSRDVHWREVARSDLNLEARIQEVPFSEFVDSTEINLPVTTFRPGGSTIPDYLLLVALCKKYHQCDYFEIGTFMGESIVSVSQYCRNCVSLSLAEEEYAATDDGKAQAKRTSRMFSRALPNVTHLYGDSQSFDFGTIRGRFDVIFVDGGHRYEQVKSDTRNAIELLRDDDSIIVFHDAKNVYNVIEPEVMCGIYDGTPSELRRNLFTVENTLCAVFHRKGHVTTPRINLRASLYAEPKVLFKIDAKASPV